MDNEKIEDFNENITDIEKNNIIPIKDGLIKEINKKVYIKDNKGNTKQLLKEVKFQD